MNTELSQIFEDPRLAELVRLQCEIQFDFGFGNYYIKNSLNKQTQSPLWVVYDLQKNWLKTYPCNFDCGYKKVKLFSVKNYNEEDNVQ